MVPNRGNAACGDADKQKDGSENNDADLFVDYHHSFVSQRRTPSEQQK